MSLGASSGSSCDRYSREDKRLASYRMVREIVSKFHEDLIEYCEKHSDSSTENESYVRAIQGFIHNNIAQVKEYLDILPKLCDKNLDKLAPIDKNFCHALCGIVFTTPLLDYTKNIDTYIKWAIDLIAQDVEAERSDIFIANDCTRSMYVNGKLLRNGVFTSYTGKELTIPSARTKVTHVFLPCTIAKNFVILYVIYLGKEDIFHAVLHVAESRQHTWMSVQQHLRSYVTSGQQSTCWAGQQSTCWEHMFFKLNPGHDRIAPYAHVILAMMALCQSVIPEIDKSLNFLRSRRMTYTSWFCKDLKCKIQESMGIYYWGFYGYSHLDTERADCTYRALIFEVLRVFMSHVCMPRVAEQIQKGLDMEKQKQSDRDSQGGQTAAVNEEHSDTETTSSPESGFVSVSVSSSPPNVCMNDSDSECQDGEKYVVRTRSFTQ